MNDDGDDKTARKLYALCTQTNYFRSTSYRMAMLHFNELLYIAESNQKMLAAAVVVDATAVRLHYCLYRLPPPNGKRCKEMEKKLR